MRLATEERALLERAARSHGASSAVAFARASALESARRVLGLDGRAGSSVPHWIVCNGCSRAIADPHCALVTLGRPAPCCGANGMRRMWPSGARAELEAIATLDASDPVHARAAVLFLAAACEVLLDEILWDIVEHHRPTRPVAVALMERASERRRSLELYRELVGKSVRDVLVGTAFARWYDSWDELVKARNGLAHGAWDSAGKRSLSDLVAAVRGDMLAAFAYVRNAALDALDRTLAVASELDARAMLAREASKGDPVLDDTRFPWPLPSPAPLLPSMSTASLDDHRRDAAILEWFARTRGDDANARGPLRRWVESLRSVATGGPIHDVPKHERIIGGSASSSRNLAAIVDYYAARQVAHSVRLIETMVLENKVEHLEIDPSFVRGELRRPDYSANDKPTLPAGGGTLLLAAQCARAGARDLVIHGSKSQGVDVEWTTTGGTRFWFECKARAFGAAFAPDATLDDFIDYVRREVAAGADGIADAQARRADDGAVRVVHISAFVPSRVADRLHDSALSSSIAQRLGGRADQRLPHFVVLHWLGMDVDTSTTTASSLRHYVHIPQALPTAPDGAHEWLKALTNADPG